MKHLENSLSYLGEVCSRLPDKRRGSNIQYSMNDIGMAAFSLFFMQHASFLAFQRSMRERLSKDNTQTLFGMNKIPTDNHIRSMLDDILPENFNEVFFHIIHQIPRATKNVLKNHTLIALDGSEYYCSKKLCCPMCNKRKRSDGNEEFFHVFLAATIVKPGDSKVYNLPPEFVRPQDGASKQDCEWQAAKRWLSKMGERCSSYNPVYLGDDLYAKQEICEIILSFKSDFIFACKDSSHKTLAEFRKGIKPERHTEIKRFGKEKREFTYSWICGLPIRDGKDALSVNWVGVTISHNGKVTRHQSFVTSIKPDKKNIGELVACARARWKIENETFNVLKNNGYHLEHNFGHGKNTLSSILVTLNLLAFSMHNLCDGVEGLWQEARKVCGARKRLFIHMWNLTVYHYFSSWNSLMQTILTKHPPPT